MRKQYKGHTIVDCQCHGTGKGYHIASYEHGMRVWEPQTAWFPSMAAAKKAIDARAAEGAIAMTPLEVIGEAAKLIEDRKHWARGAMARNKYGREVPIDSDRAVRWCLTGALWYVAPTDTDYTSAANALYRKTREAGVGERGIVAINDLEGRLAVESLLGLMLS